MLNTLVKKINFSQIILLFLIFLPLIIVLSNIYYGKIAFWHDPARDMLLALANLSNPTLIGQPSGIPGLYYGPYWIWMISLVTFFTKDPRVVSFALLTIPYFTIFPFFFYKISKRWGFFVFLSLWLIFVLNFSGYAFQIWNVNLAPLFLLVAMYFSINSNPGKDKKSRLNFFVSGILTGLIINFHMSLGMAVFLGFLLYFFTIHILEINKIYSLAFIKKVAINLSLFIIGISITFLPFLMFEVRHDFYQTRVYLDAVINSMFYNSAVVGVTGLTDGEIIFGFLKSFSKLFAKTPTSFSLT